MLLCGRRANNTKKQSKDEEGILAHHVHEDISYHHHRCLVVIPGSVQGLEEVVVQGVYYFNSNLKRKHFTVSKRESGNKLTWGGGGEGQQACRPDDHTFIMCSVR